MLDRSEFSVLIVRVQRKFMQPQQRRQIDVGKVRESLDNLSSRLLLAGATIIRNLK
jgi:hypothetical protein